MHANNIQQTKSSTHIVELYMLRPHLHEKEKDLMQLIKLSFLTTVTMKLNYRKTMFIGHPRLEVSPLLLPYFLPYFSSNLS